MKHWLIAIVLLVTLGLTLGCSSLTSLVTLIETGTPETLETQPAPTSLVLASPTITSTLTLTPNPLPALSPMPGDTAGPATDTALPPPSSLDTTQSPGFTAAFTSQPFTSTPTKPFMPTATLRLPASTPTLVLPTEPFLPTATFMPPPSTPPPAATLMPATHTAVRPTEIPTVNPTHTPLPPPTGVPTIHPTDTALPPP